MNYLFDCQEDLLLQQNEPLKSKYSHHNHHNRQHSNTKPSDFNEHHNEINVQEEVRKIEKTLIESARREKMSQQIRSELIEKLKLKNRNLRNLPKRIKKSNNNSNNISTNTSQITKQMRLADKQNTPVVNSSPPAVYIFNHAIDQQWRKQSAMVMGLEKIDNISNRKKVQRAILSKRFKKSYRNKRNTAQLSSNKSITSLNNLQAAKQAQLVLQNRQQQKQILKQIQPTPFEKYYLHCCSGSLQSSPIKNSHLQSKIHSVNVSPQKDGKMSKNELQMIQNVIDHRLNKRFNQKKNNFIFRMNQICKEIKSKEGKLNGYFKKFGDKFVPRQRASAEESQIKKIITWDLKGYQPATYSKTQRKSIDKVNKKQQQKTNEIPSTLLTQIQTFYSLAQSTQNKNSFKRSHLNRTKSQLNSNTKQKQGNDEQFSDRKIQRQNCLIFQNKSMKICEKIQQLKKQKNKRAIQKKIWHSTCKNWSQKVSQSPNTRLGRIIKYF